MKNQSNRIQGLLWIVALIAGIVLAAGSSMAAGTFNLKKCRRRTSGSVSDSRIREATAILVHLRRKALGGVAEKLADEEGDQDARRRPYAAYLYLE